MFLYETVNTVTPLHIVDTQSNLLNTLLTFVQTGQDKLVQGKL